MSVFGTVTPCFGNNMAARTGPDHAESMDVLFSRIWSLGRVLVLILMCTAWTEGSEIACSRVKYAYDARGFNNSSPVPRKPLSGTHLRICTQSPTCCTEEMENKFRAESQLEFVRVLQQTIGPTLNTFTSRARRFDEFFRELLLNSKKDFHEMFRRTYGILYEQNSYVFTDFFKELENYYVKGQISLEEAIDSFFTTLYQRMFAVLNTQYHFDERYLSCVSEHMEELKPFGDVPKKLSVQLKRSFVATRTFAQTLAIGRDIVGKILKIDTSPECGKALTKMTHCPACQGLPELKPCNNYCINVMKGCLAYHAELDTQWNNFVDALVSVSDRLLGPFNIELVVDPIDIKISDAIMNFQENGYDVSQKVFKGCGQPRLRKRDATELKFETVKFGKPNHIRPTTAAGTNLDTLVKDIKQRIKVTRGFWTKLPYQMCTNEKVAASPIQDSDCWNGLEKARYKPQITGDGMSNQVNNPEVFVDVSRPNSLLNEQLFTLKLVTNKLKNAYNGIDVVWMDHAEDDDLLAGSGSGDSDWQEEERKEVSRENGRNRGRNRDQGMDGSGYGTHYDDEEDNRIEGSGAEMPRWPVDRGSEGKENNDIVFTGSGNPDASDVDHPSTKGAAPNPPAQQKMSLTKAVTMYVLPVVVMWFGSIF